MAIGSIASGRLEPTTVGEMRVSPAGGWTGTQNIPFNFNPVSKFNSATVPASSTGSIASGFNPLALTGGVFEYDPRLYTPQSVFSGSAQQFSGQLPNVPARQSDLFSRVAPQFPSQLAQPMASPAMDLRSTPAMAPTTDTITSFGNPMASRTERITSQYGTASTTLTPEQQTQRFQARQQAEQMGTYRSPERQQELLAQMREIGRTEIGPRVAELEKKSQQESTQRGYAFRQGLAESAAQRALTPSFGTEVGREATMRGAQALVEAERWKQAQAGRSPMSNEPISALGTQFQRGSMGQYSPVKNLSFNRSSRPSGQSFGGGSSFGGGFPPFDDWMQQNRPSFGDILRGGGGSSKGDFSDFALEISRRAVEEKQKQDEWRRNQIDAGLPVITLPDAQASGLPRYVGY